tara:strand:+ start:260 stop:625 length:366 start_codon:yes stop_codon:yes gene_type:complete
MSNERIDLTQFEGMTEGPWVSEEWDEGKILGPISERHRNNHPVVAVVGNGWWGDMMPESDANKRAMVAVPELIAELKECYEELDEYDKLVGLLIGNHFVETSPYETVKHLIETHQDYRASE